MWFAMMMQSEMLSMNAIGFQNAVSFAEDAFRRRNSGMLARMDGWSRWSVPQKDGSRAICLIYTSLYHTYTQNEKGWRVYKALYALLVLAALALAVGTLCFTTSFTPMLGWDIRFGWENLFGVLTAIAAVYLAYTGLYQVLAPRKQTVFQHKMGTSRFRAASVLTAALALISLAVSIGVGTTLELSGADRIYLGIKGLVVVTALALSVLELTRKCPETPNDDPLPAGAVQV